MEIQHASVHLRLTRNSTTPPMRAACRESPETAVVEVS
jgi:hypothetical protein